MESYEFPSSSSAKIYHALLNDNGLLSCDCRGWTMKREGKPRHCKHTKEVASRNGLTLEERDGQMFVAGNGAKRPDSMVQPQPEDYGISDKVLDAKTSGFVYPMLASKMPDGKDADDFDNAQWVMEEKYDGHRVVVVIRDREVSAWSRQANVRTLPDHIHQAMRRMPDGTFDGELIVPGMKSYDVTAGVNTGQEALVLFDVIELLGTSVGEQRQDVRRDYLREAYKALGKAHVELSQQFPPSMRKVTEIWDRGGEGTIIKSRSGLYRPNWRSPDWIKVKAELAATLTVVGFKEGLNGPYGIIALRDEHGIETTVKTLNNQELRDIAANPDKYLHRKLVIQYQEKTPAGKYRHACFDHWAGIGE